MAGVQASEGVPTSGGKEIMVGFNVHGPDLGHSLGTEAAKGVGHTFGQGAGPFCNGRKVNLVHSTGEATCGQVCGGTAFSV